MSFKKRMEKAQREKNDEFYTQLPDIENELRHYTEHFRNKVVYCNCDDPTVSNFWRYFSLKYESLGLKKLMATCYKNPSPDLFSDHTAERSYYLEYLGDKNDNRRPDPEEVNKVYLRGDGNFASVECIEFLKEADIVVTNPPFSLFPKYFSQLIKYDKKFLIIGHQGAMIYKEIFPLIKENKVWLGCTKVNEFAIPSDYPMIASSHYVREDGTRVIKNVNGVKWFTNLPHNNRNEKLILYKRYSPEEYPRYDNYDAIEVGKVREIPEDWGGVMGVPISFMNKYNPDQFEILGIDENQGKGRSGNLWDPGSEVAAPIMKGKKKYARLFIRHKHPKR